MLLAALLVGAALVYVVIVDPFRAPPPLVRALWVPRFDYRTPEDVRKIIDNVARDGFTDLFFQVRGNGTAFYRSQLEPWAWELSGNKLSMLGTDPGWDPLQLAIDCSKPHGIRIHAYINVLPGWKGTTEPAASAKQLWTEHPDWFMVDSLGNKMLPTSGWYAFINPVLPEVRSHLRGIVAELCRYDLAGIHLDYIRYPYDYHLVAVERHPKATEADLMRHADFSYDPASQAALFDRYGWNVSREQIVEFRCETIDRVVREISYVMQTQKPGACVLSASVLGNPVEGRHLAYQDSGAWARGGLVDWVVQMNYATRSFAQHLKAMKKAAGRKGFRSSVMVGLYCRNNAQQILQQIDQVEASGCRGIALFSYGLLYDKQHQPTELARAVLPRIGQMAEQERACRNPEG